MGGGAIEEALFRLTEEAEAIDALLEQLPDSAFDQATPFCNWTVGDVVRHLIMVDWQARLAITDRPVFEEASDRLRQAGSVPVPGEAPHNQSYYRLRAHERATIGMLPRADLIARWRDDRDRLAEAAMRESEDRRIGWYGPPMRISRLLAARLMEYYCYGQDLYDALQIKRHNRDHIHSVADFGVRTRGYSFTLHGLDTPPMPRIELVAPSGRVWTWGDENADDRITGMAEQFCLVVTQRRNIADTGLKLTGTGARRWMDICQTIAGTVHYPPEPGERAWEYGQGICQVMLPHVATVPAMIAYLAERHGDLVQVIDQKGAVTFADMDARSAELAKALLAAGAPKGARIGIWMPNGADWLAAMLAVQRIGGVAVLISVMAKGRELAKVLQHSDIHMLLSAAEGFGHDMGERLEQSIPSLKTVTGGQPLYLAEVPFLRSIIMWGQGAKRPWAHTSGAFLASADVVDEAFLEVAQAQVVPADPAVIIYTSGSSAEPKAVVHSHGNLVRQCHRMSSYMTYQPGDRLITSMPMFWVGGLVTSLMAANYNGAALVCPDTPAAEDIHSAVIRHGVSHVALWPSQLGPLLAHPDFVEVKTAFRPNSAQQLGLFGMASADRTPNSLGMTETLGPHSMEYFGDPLPMGKEGSFGRAVGTMERVILDPETGARLGAGEKGEIALRGGHMMLGMHRREAPEVWTRDGFYRTGDMGWIDEDGYLFFDGRAGEMVKMSGANISPREVELAFLQLPQVQEAAVLGIPDPAVGELLVAALILKPGAIIDEDTAKATIGRDMSSYKVPRRIFFLSPDEMPRTPSAKICKPDLKDWIVRRIGQAAA